MPAVSTSHSTAQCPFCTTGETEGPGGAPLIPGFARAPALHLLSSREREVLVLLGQGLTNRLMARRMGISERTVKAHVTQVLTKLNVQARGQAALVALLHHRLLPPGGN